MENQYPIVVIAAIIKNPKGKYLITQRLASMHNALRWEFPGGKPVIGEEIEQCLAREVREELGINIKVKNLFDVSNFIYEKEGTKKHIILIAYECIYKSGKIKKKDVNDFAWVSKDEFSKYDITEADQRFVKKLRG